MWESVPVISLRTFTAFVIVFARVAVVVLESAIPAIIIWLKEDFVH